MATDGQLVWQPTLFDQDRTAIDAKFNKLKRINLDEESWIDFVPGWVSGADELFAAVFECRDWSQRSRHMYDEKVREPRLTSPWHLDSGTPLEPEILEEIRKILGKKYGVEFDSVGFNLYRDGRDSVAWHADKIRSEIEAPIVALVSLGHPRKFLMRPAGGGRSRAFMLGHGDLLVTGGLSQRKWEHSVPKVAYAGPRISLAYRHGMDRSVYKNKTVEPASEGS